MLLLAGLLSTIKALLIVKIVLLLAGLLSTRKALSTYEIALVLESIGFLQLVEYFKLIVLPTFVE